MTMRWKLVVVACAFVSTMSPIANAGTIRTVNATGPGTVGPWINAVTTVEAALAAAQPGDEVWIAAGTYRPIAPAYTFAVPNGVTIRGGFAGNESTLSDRSLDAGANRTRLAGTTPQFFSNLGSIHVVTIRNSSLVVLDRLTIQEGGRIVSSTLTVNDLSGAGLYALGSTIAVTDCVFENNTASSVGSSGYYGRYWGGHGGAVGVINSRSSFLRCRFLSNQSGIGASSGCQNGGAAEAGNSGSGGAVFILGGTASFRDSEFTGNHAAAGANGTGCMFSGGRPGKPGGHGGAIYSTAALVSVFASTFTQNSSGTGGSAGSYTLCENMANGGGGLGGAIYTSDGTLVVDGCRFVDNLCGDGGGRFGGCNGPGGPGGSGGAIYSTGSGLVFNSLFVRNRAGNGGGGGTSGVTTQVSYPGGSGGWGGAVYLGSSNTRIANCTFVLNIHGIPGNGTPNGQPGSAGGLFTPSGQFSNCILWANTSNQYAGAYSLAPNCVQGQYPGSGGTSADPQFVDPMDDFRLQSASPCRSLGLGDQLPVASNLDVAGSLRSGGSCAADLASGVNRVDAGAFQSQAAAADCNANGLCDLREVSGSLIGPVNAISGQRYGWGVALSGDDLYTSARSKPLSSTATSGEVAVLSRRGSVFTYPVSFNSPDTALDSDFGNQLAVTPEWLFIGARWAHGASLNCGAVFAYRRVPASVAYIQRISPADLGQNDQFGHGVSADESTLVIGALSGDAPAAVDAGAAYVYTPSAWNQWSQQSKLTASDAATGDGFGISVGVSGDTAVVGAPYLTHNGVGSGGAYIFERSGTAWSQVAKLTPPDGASGDTFGELVAISGDTIMVNAPRHSVGGLGQAGKVYIYRKSAGQWSPAGTLVSNAPQSGELFGFGLALKGDRAVIGGFGRSFAPNHVQSGAAYAYKLVNQQWKLAARIDNPESEPFSRFGYSVAIDADTFAVGAISQSVRGVASVGAVRVFSFASLDANRNGVPDSCDIASGVLPDADMDGIPDAVPGNICPADFNNDGALAPLDIFDFLNAWFLSSPNADFNGQNGITPQDIFDYLNAWFAGC